MWSPKKITILPNVYLHKPNILKYCELLKEWRLFFCLLRRKVNLGCSHCIIYENTNMVPFPKYVLWFRPPTNMVAVTRNKKFSKKILKKLLWNHLTNCIQTYVEWSLDGPLPNYVRWSRPPTTMAAVSKNWKFSKKMLKKSFLWNCSAPKHWWNDTWMVPFQKYVWWSWPQ